MSSSPNHPYPGPDVPPMPTTAPPADVREPIPVLSIPPRVVLPLILLVPAAILAVMGIVRLASPVVNVVREPGRVTFAVERGHVSVTAVIFCAVGVLAVATFFTRPHRWLAMLAAVALTLAIGFGLGLWQQAVARAELTPTTLVAPARVRGIFPGDPVTVRLDKLAMLELVGDPAERETHYQRAYAAPGVYVDLDLGPLYRTTYEELVAAAQARGVKVMKR
ncbi:MAG TPA: hypothetical protein VK986_05645 [Tepidisphaeraceae bacterium]|nr:hypothetical protein [Tepidisphaeraceae bacterium]